MQNAAVLISQKAIRKLCHKEVWRKSRNKRERCCRLQNFADFCPPMLPNGIQLSDIGGKSAAFRYIVQDILKTEKFLKKISKIA